jgi:hypothetical protein
MTLHHDVVLCEVQVPMRCRIMVGPVGAGATTHHTLQPIRPLMNIVFDNGDDGKSDGMRSS